MTSSPTIANAPEKILALQFKYFGDAVLLTPALRALREHFPDGELHLLVPEEIAPLFQHLPHLNRVWPMPRRRGRAQFGQSWPMIRALRRERFDRSVDFASNDRGAIISRFIGARRRLGWGGRGGFFGRKFCYTDRVAGVDAGRRTPAGMNPRVWRNFCPAGRFRRRLRSKLKSTPIRPWPLPQKNFSPPNAPSFAMSPPASPGRNGRCRIGPGCSVWPAGPDFTSSSPPHAVNASRH